MSAVAARKARQQQAQNVTTAKAGAEAEPASEPPQKRPRRSFEKNQAKDMASEPRITRTRSKKQGSPTPTNNPSVAKQPTRSNDSEQASSHSEIDEEPQEPSVGGPDYEVAGEMSEDEVASVAGDPDGYESPAETPAELQNFPLSKARLSKGNIVYADESTLCVRIGEKMVRFLGLLPVPC